MGLSQIDQDNRHLLLVDKENPQPKSSPKAASAQRKICLNDFMGINVDTKDIKNTRKPLKKIKFLNE